MSELKELFAEIAKAKAEAKKVQESTPAGQALRGVQERLKQNNEIGELLEVFVEKKTQPKEIVKEVIKEVVVEKVVKEESFQQPNPPEVDANLKAIQLKLKFLEQAIGKIAATGPGGGAGDVVDLDMPTKLITTATYTLNRRDYYIGVNYAGRVTITLPAGNIYNGRDVIIKDESGRCEAFPITVVGNVDNDPDGFILQINNGAIHMIYRDGWRIV
jgi:hypothetical protein